MSYDESINIDLSNNVRDHYPLSNIAKLYKGKS